jgi:hypothetical protein
MVNCNTLWSKNPILLVKEEDNNYINNILKPIHIDTWNIGKN